MANDHKSLSDIHESVDPSRHKGKFRRILSFLGPAYLVSVGYMDPGNWATDLAGGSQFGYTLIWVLLMSNLMALLLQSLSARLGIVRGQDLAQCNRETYPPILNFVLYLLAEVAIAACDLAEVLGMAIGLYLLFDIPILWGVAITFVDTFLLLYLQSLGMRKMEAFVIALIAVIGGCFVVEIFLAKPDPVAIAEGFVPSIPNHAALYIAIGIIGATVMPHNLYLHSALVQTRKVKRDPASIRKALRLNTVDSAIALNAAFFVNAAILILAAAVFYTTGNQQVATLEDAHQLLEPLLGSEWAPHLFAIALIAAGQSSTLTGTLAGQIVMEGYLRLRINPIARRLLTRLLAILPAVIVIVIMGEDEVDNMLVFSQVLLSLQLAFAVIPLIHFVSDRKKMGKFAIGVKTRIAAWIIALIIVTLNLKLVYETAAIWLSETGSVWADMLIILGEGIFALLLVITTIYPLLKRRKEKNIHIHRTPMVGASPAPLKSFRKIALALDYSEHDEKIVRYGLHFAGEDVEFVLIHIVESVSARFHGEDTRDLEARKDWEAIENYAEIFRSRGIRVTPVLGYRSRSREIARLVHAHDVDLLIVGSHGHRSFKDILFGETVNRLRHLVRVPIFIAK